MKRSVPLSIFARLAMSVMALPALLAADWSAAENRTDSVAEPLAGQISPGQLFPLGGLQGHIRDANTGQGLAGYVYLYNADDPNVEYDAYADATGAYFLTLPDPGTYDVYGTMMGYERVDATVTITNGQITELDFDLPAPVMHWAPRTINRTLAESESLAITLTISNSGTSSLFYRLEEQAPAPVHLLDSHGALSLSAPPRPSGVDPQVYADLATSPDGSTEILVVMAEQADLNAAYYISDWSARGHYVYNRLRATAGHSQDRIRKYLDRQGIAYHSHISLNGLTLSATRATVDALATAPEVGAIRPGYAYDIPIPPIDRAAVPEAIGWNVKQVEADRVWKELGVTGEGIVVAGIDTGVEWDHHALKSQYRGWNGAAADHNYNWWDPRDVCQAEGYPPGEPCDNYWHGTHTMGTMVGSDLPGDPLNAPNAIGLAPGARWIACKGCEMADDWPCSTFALLACADFVLAPWDLNGQNPDPDLRPHVVNNSWGGAANDGWFFQAIAAWRAAGIFPAFSVGNEGKWGCATATSPGDYSNAFATGATDSSDTVAYFSSRGPSRLGVAKPQVTAPGVGVSSSWLGNRYWSASGTSMASPHSAGEVALIWSAQPELIGQLLQTEELVMQTAEPILDGQCGSPGCPNEVYGWGRINAYNAVSVSQRYDWGVGWLEASPLAGTVDPGEKASIRLALDSTRLAANACYSARLALETNDPYQPPDLSVPVVLCVGDPGKHRAYLPFTSTDSGNR